MRDKKNNIIALISVRSKSSRLPNKSLWKYKDLTILDRIIINLKKSKYIDKIIVATTNKPSDQKIENYCKKKKYLCFKGDEINLFKRFYDAVKKYNPKTILRVTGDNPFTSYEIADYMIRDHLKKKVDFSFMRKDQVPSGLCPEIIKFTSLRRLMSYKLNFNYSEYLSFYFINNSQLFKVNRITPKKNFRFLKTKLRLTVDYKKDLQMIKKLIDTFSDHEKPQKLKNIYSSLINYPEIAKINNKIVPIWKKNKNLIKKINLVSKITK